MKKFSDVFGTGTFINLFTKAPNATYPKTIQSRLHLTLCFSKIHSNIIRVSTSKLLEPFQSWHPTSYFSTLRPICIRLVTCAYYWDTSIQTLFCHPVTLRLILILSSHSHPSPTHFFAFSLSNLNIFYVFLIPFHNVYCMSGRPSFFRWSPPITLLLQLLIL